MSAEEPGPHVPAGMSSQPAGPWAVFESSRVESSRVESGVGTDGTAELAGVRGVGPRTGNAVGARVWAGSSHGTRVEWSERSAGTFTGQTKYTTHCIGIGLCHCYCIGIGSFA
jgi:hypothetical protein